MDKKVKDALATLQKAGFQISEDRLRKPTVRKTFEVQPGHIEQFEEIAAKRKIKYKDAMAEMFGDWIKKWR
jgi:hypothetical protein